MIFNNTKLFFHLFETTQTPLNKLHSFKTHVLLYNVVDIYNFTFYFIVHFCRHWQYEWSVRLCFCIPSTSLGSPIPLQRQPIIRILVIIDSFNLPNWLKKKYTWNIVILCMRYCPFCLKLNYTGHRTLSVTLLNYTLSSYQFIIKSTYQEDQNFDVQRNSIVAFLLLTKWHDLIWHLALI